jgi:hypothetical protein
VAEVVEIDAEVAPERGRFLDQLEILVGHAARSFAGDRRR